MDTEYIREPETKTAPTWRGLATMSVIAVVAVGCVLVVAVNGISAETSEAGNPVKTSVETVRAPLPYPEGLEASVGGGDEMLRASSHSPELIRSLRNGDLDPVAEFKKRFNEDFVPKFVEYMNNRGPDPRRGKVTKAVILGFPENAIPTSGHVTHDSMTQMGGFHTKNRDAMQFEPYDEQWQPILVNTAVFKQDSSESAQHELRYEEKHTSSQTVTVEAGLSMSSTETVEAGVPEIAKASLSETMTVSLSTTASNTETKEQTWSETETITIPKHSVTNATCFLTTGKINTKWHVTTSVTDASNIGWVFYDDTTYTGDGAWFWMFQSHQTGAGLRYWASVVGSNLNFDFLASGTFEAVAGTGVVCEVHSCPYKPGLEECAEGNKLL